MSLPLSKQSQDRLSECDPRLVTLVTEVAREFPLLVLAGHRGEAEQNAAYQSGHSKLAWPKSKHNAVPSQAVDLAPFPYNAKDRDRLLLFAGIVLGIASRLKIPIRWGGDWDSDQLLADEKFPDLFHFELIAHPVR